MNAKKYLCIGICVFSVFHINVANATSDCDVIAWPLWESFKAHFIQVDGRVLAGTAPQFESFSEGQSYAMVFALIANDPKTFDLLWRWSALNLSNNNIASKLPAWSWGKAEDGTWRVLDENSASDADLWYAYALLEAGRLWQRSDYIADAKSILTLIEAHSVTTLPGFGKMLLPGPYGFAQPNNQWQLNPSYLPIPVLRRLTLNDKNGPWLEIANNTAKMMNGSSPKQLANDWVDYQGLSSNTGEFVTNSAKGDVGSYDAIRVYLWAGMTAPEDSLAKPMLKSLAGMKKIINMTGSAPESVNTKTGTSSGIAPLGFSAALLPYLSSSNKEFLLKTQLERAQLLQRSTEVPVYYNYVLSLFGLGWIENRYRFSSNGQIHLNWNLACAEKIK
jgi:endoglucanase